MKFNVIALASVAALAMAGCGCGGNTTTTSDINNNATNLNGQTGGPGRKLGRHLMVGVVFDSGGRGDKSFNDSAYSGTEMAKKDCDVEVKSVESRTPKDYEQNLTTLAESGSDLVFAVGIGQNKALEAVAPKYPNVKFAIIDAEVKGPNVRSLLFTEHEGSYLAGYLAGLMTTTNKIGFVGGMQIPLIKKFEVGYEAGAKTANPNVQLLPAKYTDSWDNVDTGKAAADILFSGGADIVYHASGRCGLGVIASAKEHNKYAIGVDGDQDGEAKGRVLTSMVKHVDIAVHETIKDVATDRFTPGAKVYDLAHDGVGLSAMTYTRAAIGKAKLEKVEAQAKLIKSGKLKVPSTPEELTTYLAAAASGGTAKPERKK